MQKNIQQNQKRITKIPLPHQKAAFNEIYIQSKRPLRVYLKHSQKVLTKCDTLIIHALTAAINKAINLFIVLKKEYPYLKHEIVTNSVPTIMKINEKFQLKQRSSLHITLQKDTINQIYQTAKVL